ncbi:MAG: hypothetical protein Kow0080_14400 [Candidatus Promineifilaceae bacterium]
MRSLEQALIDHELIVLWVIGEWCDLDLSGTDKTHSVKAVAEALTNLDLQQEMQYLAPEETAVLQDLIAAGGKIAVATLTRKYGDVRLMGPGRLEREEPWYDPISPVESLWYRGFIYRGFDETAEGLLEFYYIPNELLAQFPEAQTPAPKVIKESAEVAFLPVPPPEKWQTAVTDAVDDLTAILALAQRTALKADKLDKLNQVLLNPDRERRSLLVTLAREMGMLKQSEAGIRPTRVAVDWLRAGRESQLRALADAWSNSAWNELRHTPGLRCEGEGWQNDPILARTALLDHLSREDSWFRLDDLVAYMKVNEPDFQRPDGNYDTWYVRDVAEDVYLKGFESWERVEGRLLRFLVQGPMVWLGLVETAVSAGNTLFRLTGRALAWLTNQPVSDDEVKASLVVEANGRLIVPYNADRYQRFQAARISEPEPVAANKPFSYRLTPSSLAAAKEEGIAADRILQFLQEASGRPLPVSVKRAISRWSERGVEGRLETAVVLRVRDKAILDTLRQNPKTRDFIAESLGDLAAVIRQEEWQTFQFVVAELGLLLDSDIKD